jgi:hypothetical protein
MPQKYPAISEPTNDINSLRDALTSAKQAIEIITNQRGDPLTSMVSWGDLVRLGVVTPLQVPKTGK